MLWGTNVDDTILAFTVGNDYIIDKELLPFDIAASKAHAAMLAKIGVLTGEELEKLTAELDVILTNKDFEIKLEDEDCHTAIENHLTEKLGDLGKKIHTARSRNDQVLVALRLYEKDTLQNLQKLIQKFMVTTETLAKQHENKPFPGYTHMQKAMPTTVDTWLGSFIAAMQDNVLLVESTLTLIDQNPLGTAAGFGVPVFEIDREFTTEQLGFTKTQENPIYAQMSRGKFEAQILSVFSQVMADLNKLSTDLITFSMQEFGYVTLPKEFCTGSSIMPQKQNPDVLELVRAKYSVVLGEEFKVKNLIGNLLSGYNRDMQLVKEPLFTGMKTTFDCLQIMTLVLEKITINDCTNAMTKELYATEEAYKLVKNGKPFRDAYKEVGEKYS
ncbi:MAG: argininosuccinate lyase [Candidatus Woesearchaeota archaeon]|nr:argininosuccinate lyase [Candidatus Woesearchaeota archaeon]